MKPFSDFDNDYTSSSSSSSVTTSADIFTDEPIIAAHVTRDCEELQEAQQQQQHAAVPKISSRNKTLHYILLLSAVGILAFTVLIVSLTGSSSSSSLPGQPDTTSSSSSSPKYLGGTLRPVETPPPNIPSQEEGEEEVKDWNQLGGDLLGSNLGGAFGKFVTLSSDGTRLAVTSTAAERTSVSLFQQIIINGDDGDGDYDDSSKYRSLYEATDKDIYFGDQSPYYATVSGDGNHFVVAATYAGSNNSEDTTTTMTHQVQFLDFSGQAAGSPTATTSRPTLYLRGLYDVYYGRPVAISNSADYVVVGIDGWQTGGKSHVQVYGDSGNGWKQIGSDIVGDGGFSEFGNTVCISANGDIVAVADRSKFRVFQIDDQDSGDWTQMGGSEVDSHSSGVKRIALSSDGKTIATSGDGIRVYHYFEETKKWAQLGNTIEADTDSYQYYNLDRVALSGDGLTLATGTENADSADATEHVVGYVCVYRLLDGEWRQIGERIDGAKSSEAFGSSLSLTADGSRLAVAAPGNEQYSATVGAVRVYDLV